MDTKISADEDDRLLQMANVVYQKMQIFNIGNLQQAAIIEEIVTFLYTGNFDCDIDNIFKSGTDKKCCMNVTFYCNSEEIRKVHQHRMLGHLACPFDAFFPVPLREQLSPDFGLTKTSSVYDYCKMKLQSLISELRSNKKRVIFNFHFSDSLELCLRKPKMKNKFHIVHCCSALMDCWGLANIIPATSDCLIEENQDAFVMTETKSWTKQFQQEKPSFIEYVEKGLGCPVSLIPTLYGMRLTNHLQFGSAVCVSLHDTASTNAVTLKWLNDSGYSSNVKLDISPDLQAAVARLAELCFVETRCCTPTAKKENFERKKALRQYLPYTPVTYFYVLQSLVKRCVWIEGAAESLFLSAVPTPLRLAWRTLHDWLKGVPVLIFSRIDTKMQKFIYWFENFELLLMNQRDLLGPWEPVRFEQFKSQIFHEYLGHTAHCIDHLFWSSAKETFTHVTSFFHQKRPTIPNCSFLLTKDHGLDSKLWFFYAKRNEAGMKIIFFDLFQDFSSREVVNPDPLEMKPLRSPAEAEQAALRVLRCLESADRYDIEIGLRKDSLQHIKGKMYSIL